MNIDLVGVADVDRIWAQVAGLAARGLRKAPAEFGPGDIWVQVRSGNWLMVVARNEAGGLAGFSTWHFTNNNYFVCSFLAGENMDAWLPETLEAATNIAKSNGCIGLGGTCRPGLMLRLQRKYLPRAKAARIQFISEF